MCKKNGKRIDWLLKGAITGGAPMVQRSKAETLETKVSKTLLLYCDHWQNGGVESYLMNLLRNERPAKLKCTLLTADKTTDIYDNELQQMGIKHTVLLSKTYVSPVRRILHTFGAFKIYIKQHPCDIVYLNLSNSVTMHYARLAQRCGVVRRIVHSHCSDVKPGPSRPVKKLGSLIARQLNADAVTDCWACSDKAAKWMFPQRLQKKVVFIPNAIDTRKFMFQEDARSAVRQRLGVEAKTVVGNVGRFTTQKNQRFLLEAFAGYHKKNKASILLLVGAGPLRTQVETQANELGVEDNCIFLGSVVAENMPPLYWAMDVFCLPSTIEGNPVAGIEAQAAGCKCLFSDTITRQVGILEDVAFLPIDTGIDCWIKELEKTKPKKLRQNAQAAAAEAGYNIEEVSRITWKRLLNEVI